MGFSLGKGQILIKFHDGKWKELKQQIDSIFSQEYPEVRYRLFNTEEEYAGYLKSENALIKLLSFVTTVCIIIAAFGIFSLITLSCEQRRKEIAIRKVNGVYNPEYSYYVCERIYAFVSHCGRHFIPRRVCADEALA